MEKSSYYNTPTFSFANKEYKCKILDIYDGDTINLGLFIEGFNVVKLNARLNGGIDTPELKGEQKNLGIIARNYLINILTNISMDNNKEYTRKEIRELIYNSNNNFIDVKFGDFDKYGRPLVIIYKDGININNAMIVGGYAKKYNGGKKEDWED